MRTLGAQASACIGTGRLKPALPGWFLALLLLSGCTSPFSRSPDPQPPEAASLDQHVAWLERAIKRLEGSRTAGRGAQRNGSSLRVEQDGSGGPGNRSGSPLERLAASEHDLAEARRTAESRENLITDLRRQLATANSEGRTLAERNDYLNRTERSLAVAQQALAERERDAATMRDQLDAAELAKLKAERDHHVIAAAVLRLQAGQARDLTMLQEDVREAVRTWERQRRAEGWSPEDKGGAAHEAPADSSAAPAHGAAPVGHAAPAHGAH